MVRNAYKTLKIGVHLPFDPNFDVRIGTFYPEKFRQAYYVVGIDFGSPTHLDSFSCLLSVLTNSPRTQHRGHSQTGLDFIYVAT